MNKIKSQILEICEEVTFKRGLTDKLYGCAEMFGEDCMKGLTSLDIHRQQNVKKSVISIFQAKQENLQN